MQPLSRLILGHGWRMYGECTVRAALLLQRLQITRIH